MSVEDPADPSARPEQAALQRAVQALLQPLARLAVARGLPYHLVEEGLREAFVEAALSAHPDIAPTRAVSRVSAATGLNRREVTRLIHARGSRGRPRPPHAPAAEVVTRWLADPALREPDGLPRALPRQGAAPSFEALAHTVTRDVHPRSLLEELLRLGMAHIDAEDRVRLAQDAFVPREDQARMLGFLGENVGDHLQAAVDNVLGRDPAHVEQAIYQDALSAQSVEALRPLVRDHWRRLLAEAIPRLEALEAEDRAAQRPLDRRLRLGLFSYSTAAEPPAGDAAAAPPADAPAPDAAPSPDAPRPRGRRSTPE